MCGIARAGRPALVPGGVAVGSEAGKDSPSRPQPPHSAFLPPVALGSHPAEDRNPAAP